MRSHFLSCDRRFLSASSSITAAEEAVFIFRSRFTGGEAEGKDVSTIEVPLLAPSLNALACPRAEPG